ncbi:hypothetical protein GOP47_0017949 [Adiantum capillus-veneris]|uniref:Cytochrome P450 n=1 Tax=Adiantum capillus-veneris TaxID=13818 RepID=A0A9D4ZCA5_ADICA|nr:hypothetical protein GOP47_0017949 [Adiantum capillus-veneris]
METLPILQASLAFLLGLALLLLFKLGRTPSVKPPPGPLGWPIIGSLLQYPHGLTPQALTDLTASYGDIFMVKLGQLSTVVVSSPTLAIDVLQTHGVEFGARPRNLLFDVLTSKGQDLVFADYGDHYKKVRRICTPPFFSGKAIQQCRQGWEEELTITMDTMRQLPDAAMSGIIIKDHLQMLMYSLVYRMMFSRRFSGPEDPLYMEIMRLNANSRQIIVNSKKNNRIVNFFPCLKPFLKSYLDEVRSANRKRLTFFKTTFIEGLIKEKEGRAKVGVDPILDAHAKGELSDDTVLYLIQNINVAAIDTTVWVMEWGVAVLVNNKHIQETLRNELDSILGKGIPVTEPDLARLPYLQAVVKEVLRQHMVIPLLLPHQNLKPAKIGKYDIPARSKVLVNARGMANDPKYWKSPEVFDPTRFLDANIEMSGNDMRFMPFGSGRRSCPGMAMAVVVLSLALGRMVQEFELLPPLGKVKVDMKPAGVLVDAHILAEKSKVVLKPRDT